MKRAISLSVIIIGFTAMASQIILMRELLAVFYGNEISIGFILASWLAGGAMGSAVLGRYADRLKSNIGVLALCQIILSILLPINILEIRSLKTVCGVNTGETIPLFPMLVSSFVVLVPICITLGFIFAVACRAMGGFPSNAERRGGLNHSCVQDTGKVYVLESIGAMAGGIMASFVLIRIFNPLLTTAILALLNISSALILIFLDKEGKFRKILTGIAVFLLLAIVFLWASGGWGNMDTYLLNSQWRGYELVDSKNSIYGNVAVTKKFDQISFFDNGLHLYTVPDRQTAEESVHFAMLEHPDPEDVLLIGGGAGGLISEALKHPVRHIDYVELDPLIINMAMAHLPDEYRRALIDARVTITNLDGRLFVKNTGNRYDCIIMHVGDPYTAQINRFYTVEFFKEVKNILMPGGLVAFSAAASEDYISKDQADYLRSLYSTLKMVFRDVIAIPGNPAYFLACDEPGRLTYDHKLLMERARARGLDLQYVREYYLFSRLSNEKISYLDHLLNNKERAIRINYDFRPAAYYYAMVFWTTYFRDSVFSVVLKAANESNIWLIVAGMSLIILLSGIDRRRKKNSFRQAALAAVMVTGFSMMAFQVIILLAFQAVYGYVFGKLGILLTSFMTGLALGGWSAVKTIDRIGSGRGVLLLVQAAIFTYAALLPILPYYYILPVIAGFLGGFQFPVANRICLEGQGGAGRTGGLIYGIDLAGSCLGALLVGTFMIPVLGIPQACLAVSVLNAAATLAIFFSKNA